MIHIGKIYFSKSFASFLIAFIVFISFLFSQTPEWFFFWSTKEKVDFVNATGEYDPNGTLAYFHGSIINIPQTLSLYHPPPVLGESTPSNKRIEVDLTNQKIYAFEGNNKVYDFLISSGKHWWPTPNGTFYPWIKLRYTRMTGTGYNLPNVPYTIFFYNEKIPKWKGYGLHGTYWHNNFGHPMSHGCVNVRTEDMEKLYYWIDPPLPDGKPSMTIADGVSRTPIIIYGETPKS